jgi:hypothetical protein
MVTTRRGRDLSRQAPRAAALALLLAGSTSHAAGAVPASAWDLVRDGGALKPASAASHAALVRAVARASGHVELAQAEAGAKSAGAKKPAATAISTQKPAATAISTQKPAATAVSTQKPAEVAGRYAVLRDKTRDTGCMVTLDDKAHGPGATFKARLAPACRDQGVVIFDPVGWQMQHGQLVLTARKGHTTELITQDDGSWMNDPKKGKTLSLKKI